MVGELDYSIRIDTARAVDDVDPRIYSGFTEHMGRCIYGGIYDPGNKLSDPTTGFRMDVLETLKSLKVPIVRYPGGNFVSSYRWQDGIGSRENRPRRPELAWLNEESNQFGTDEFMQWCAELGAEPYVCLNMGTGTLEDALGWLEYCNGSGNTYYVNLRRKNGRDKPYGVKYWSLGNEVWGPWQVGQMTSGDYAKTAFQWAKALRLLDPTIKLISCGETGFSDWDRVTLKVLAPVVDFHSIHHYSKSEGDHGTNVTGRTLPLNLVNGKLNVSITSIAAAAEKGIQITRSLIDLAKIENNLSKPLTICFDEWNVWDPERAPGDKGAEERYDLSDALAVAAWLNAFIRNADIVKIACIAQSVNVISPILTTPEGLIKQTIFYPLQLFAQYMQGTALDIGVVPSASSTPYTGKTFPSWISALDAHVPNHRKLTNNIDASAVLSKDGKQLRVALLNRAGQEATVRLSLVGVEKSEIQVEVSEIWHKDLTASNTEQEEKVRIAKSSVKLTFEEGAYGMKLKASCFQLLIIDL